MDVSLSGTFRSKLTNPLRGAIAIVLATTTVAIAAVWGRSLSESGVDVRLGAPPLYGDLAPHTSAWIAVPLGVAVLIFVLQPRLKELSWKSLVIAISCGSLLWGAALALIEGPTGLLGSVESQHDYLAAVPQIHTAGGFLAGFVEKIATYPVHVQGHPPGLPLALWGLDRPALAGPPVVAFLFATAGALAVVAVLVALKEVADERPARLAAPFVAFAPAVITSVTSADALFTGVIAWGVTLVVLATGRHDRAGDFLGAGGGVLMGLSLFLTYGAIPALLPAPVVAIARRRIRPLLSATIGILVVVLSFGVAGFWWWDGLAATLDRYQAGVGGARPSSYFLVANLAVLALMLGPAGVAGLARRADRRVRLLAGAGALGVALANLSGLSRGEVERIWLPFIPWLLVGTASLIGARRAWIGAQLGVALALAFVVRSPW